LLERRDDHERGPARGEVLLEVAHQSRRHSAPVGTPVEREVVPPIGVAFLGQGRKIRRVREHPVKTPEPSSEVGPDHGQVHALVPCAGPKESERVGVKVGRNHTRPTACRPERGKSGSRAHLDHTSVGIGFREAEQEEGVLSRRVDGRRVETRA
jgi:hypothetical protein